MSLNEIARTGEVMSDIAGTPTEEANERNFIGAEGSRGLIGSSGIVTIKWLCGIPKSRRPVFQSSHTQR